MPIKNRAAIVTGASRGLGSAIAREYLRAGARLAITARDGAALARTADALGTYGEVFALAGDVAEPQHAQRLVAETVQRFGGIDILVNNASELGPSPMPPLEMLRRADYERILAVNAVAPLHLAQLALPHLRRVHGIVINVSSDAGVNAYAGWGGYGSSKAALEHWSAILAEEIKGQGVRVLVVDPGDMDTQMHRLAEPGADLSHLPSPEFVAPAFVRMLDEPRSFARLEAQQLLAGAALA